MPAVFSRAASSSNSHKRKAHLSYEEKSHLLQIGKRPRKGPFNSIVDPTEFGAGSAIIELSEAVKESGKYDSCPDPRHPPPVARSPSSVLARHAAPLLSPPGPRARALVAGAHGGRRQQGYMMSPGAAGQLPEHRCRLVDAGASGPEYRIYKSFGHGVLGDKMTNLNFHPL